MAFLRPADGHWDPIARLLRIGWDTGAIAKRVVTNRLDADRLAHLVSIVSMN